MHCPQTILTTKNDSKCCQTSPEGQCYLQLRTSVLVIVTNRLKASLSDWIPWTARRSNQSILKEINPEYSLEGLMLKLKLQSFGYQMQRADSLEKPRCWKRLQAREGDDRGQDAWMASLTQRT